MNEVLQGIFLGFGLAIFVIAALGRGAIGIAMNNNGGFNKVDSVLAWVFCSPFLVLGIYLIIWASTL